MTNLPSDAEARAAQCDFISAQRRNTILGHLKGLNASAQSAAIATIIQGGGIDARFLTHVLGKDERGVNDSPRNKKLGPPETQ